MRLIRPAPRRDERRTAVLMSLAMLVVGVTAIGLMALLPGDRISGLALLGIAAALGIGIGLAWLIRALSSEPRQLDDDLARLLAPAFDDTYVLILSPRLPDVPSDLAACWSAPPACGRCSPPLARSLSGSRPPLGVRHQVAQGLDPVPHQPILRRRRGGGGGGPLGAAPPSTSRACQSPRRWRSRDRGA